MVNNHMKRCFHIITYKNANSNHNDTTACPSEWLKFKILTKTVVAIGVQLEFLYLLMGL